LGYRSRRTVLDKIEFPERWFKIPKLKIVKSPELRVNRAATLQDIAVFDSPPFLESPIENALLRGLHETDYNDL
jgi:hypothetical protein